MRAARVSTAWQFTLSRTLRKAGDLFARTVLLFFGIVLMCLALAVLVAAVKGGSFLWFRGTALLDKQLLTALGSLLLGFSGIYIGSRLRKFQEMEARARANLALNVELRSRVVNAGDREVLEVVIEVHNVSRTTWFVPMAYLFVRSAVGGKDNIPIQRSRRNLADYTASLCQLQPDEKDQFFATLVFPVPDSPIPPAVVVTAEVVGTSERWLGPHKEKMRFVNFMQEYDGSRHNYYCIGRCNAPKHKWYGRRIFIEPDGSMDSRATEMYRGLLDDVMLWSREMVVALPSACREAEHREASKVR
jgi:hypothetical protein